MKVVHFVAENHQSLQEVFRDSLKSTKVLLSVLFQRLRLNIKLSIFSVLNIIRNWWIT